MGTRIDRRMLNYTRIVPDTDDIPGMAMMEGSVKILLDIDRVLNADKVAGPAKPA